MRSKLKSRSIYAVMFCVVLIAEILIALYVRDSFIRPYGGDILVTILICLFVRIIFPSGLQYLPAFVFLFSLAVEIGQYFDIVTLLGLGNNELFKIVLGTTFSWADMICYAVGCILFWLVEKTVLKKALG